MASHAVVPLLSLPESNPILFLSLPEPVHENTVRFIGGGCEDVPESYGASLIVLAGVMPYYEEAMVHCKTHYHADYFQAQAKTE